MNEALHDSEVLKRALKILEREGFSNYLSRFVIPDLILKLKAQEGPDSPVDEPQVKLLIWNDETKAKEHGGRPDPAYIIGLGSGSVLELKNNKDHTVLHMEVGEVGV
uniref:Uncharacterized protein n=1 Tax=viral metagenome TaxID=1070528 RepID=A0A6M3MAG9_9ZZZZ